jgi:hypothetical protein
MPMVLLFFESFWIHLYNMFKTLVFHLINTIKGGYKMLAYWLNENGEYRNMTDTLMGVIYSLRITDKRMLSIITGWTDVQIRGALQRIREMGNDWLRTWQPKHRSPYVYTLGEKGIEHVKALRDDALGYEEDELSIKGQIGHFMGTNKILTRAIEAGLPVENWYSTKDTMSYLHYQMRPAKSPVSPDALLKLENGSHLLEFDTGSENGGKIENKIHRYLMLSVMIGRIFPITWVAMKPSRVALIERKANEAINTYLIKMKKEIEKRKLPLTLPKEIPLMYAFVEGEETSFLAGQKATPILGTE